jgi:hypothetical protein
MACRHQRWSDRQIPALLLWMMQLMLPDYPVIKGDGIRGAIRLCPRVKLKRRVGPPEGGPYPAFLDTSAQFGDIIALSVT